MMIKVKVRKYWPRTLVPIIFLFIALLATTVWGLSSHEKITYEKIPCSYQTVKNSSYPTSISTVSQECQTGIRKVVHKDTNLFSIDKGLVSSNVTKPMLPEIRQQGTGALRPFQPTIIQHPQSLDSTSSPSTDCSTSYIGSSGFTNCYSSDGTSTSCSSSYIGNTKLTHCY